jgi:hypothetical protein
MNQVTQSTEPRAGTDDDATCCVGCKCQRARGEPFDPRLAAGAFAAFICLFGSVLVYAVCNMAGVSLAGELFDLTRAIGLTERSGAFLGVMVALFAPWSVIYFALRRFVPLYRGGER